VLDPLLRGIVANPAAVTCGVLTIVVCLGLLAAVLLDVQARKAETLRAHYEALRRERDRLKRDHDA